MQMQRTFPNGVCMELIENILTAYGITVYGPAAAKDKNFEIMFILPLLNPATTESSQVCVMVAK